MHYTLPRDAAGTPIGIIGALHRRGALLEQIDRALHSTPGKPTASRRMRF